MSNTNDGGPAFPRFVSEGHYNGSVDESGMTLRDYFAGKALSVMPYSPQSSIGCVVSGSSDIAIAAYAIADAMLIARQQTQTPEAT